MPGTLVSAVCGGGAETTALDLLTLNKYVTEGAVLDVRGGCSVALTGQLTADHLSPLHRRSKVECTKTCDLETNGLAARSLLAVPWAGAEEPRLAAGPRRVFRLDYPIVYPVSE